VLTEVGPDLADFPTEDHFVSWLRLCPHTPISGGKPLGKRRQGLGATRIAAALRMAATALQRSKTALGAALRRHARRKGGTVAIFAIARQLARLIYRMLRYGNDYLDEGAPVYEARFRDRRLRGLTRAAHDLGYQVVPRSAETAA
jgi:transposase